MTGSGEGDGRNEAVESLVEVLGVEKTLVGQIGTKGLLKLLVVGYVQLCNNLQKRLKVRKFIAHLKEEKLAGVRDMLYLLMLESLASTDVYVTTKSSSKSALEMLKWIIILGKGSKNLSPTYCRLLGILLTRIRSPRLERAAEKKTKLLISTMGTEEYAATFKQMFVIGNLVGIGVFAARLHKLGSEERRKLEAAGVPTTGQVLELFVKECFMTKTAKDAWIINKASSLIFQNMYESEDNGVGNVVIPGIQKGMLRSPEITAEALSIWLKSIENVPLGLDPFIPELSKALGSCLYSKEDVTREHAMTAAVSLANKLSGGGIVKVLERFLDVYNGSEGKLTVVAHKIGILKVVQQSAPIAKRNMASGERDSANAILTRAVKIVETEVHEGTVVEAFKVIESWLPIVEPGKKHVELANYYSKQFPNLKGNLRTTACHVLVGGSGLAALGLETNKEIADFCSKVYQKSRTQIPQPNALAECVCMCKVMIGIEVEDKSQLNEWLKEIVPHMNEKYIAVCYNDFLVDAFKLLSLLFGRDVFNSAQYEGAFLALSAINDYKIRKELVDYVRKNHDEIRIATEFSTQITTTIRKIFEQNLVPENGRKGLLYLLPQLLQLHRLEDEGVMQTFDVEEIFLDFLPLCHLCPEKDMWVRLLKSFPSSDRDISEVLGYHYNTILSTYIMEGFDESPLTYAILKTLAREGGKYYVGELIRKALWNAAEWQDILNVSREEYFIFMTPDDQLFDTSVIDAADGNAKNLKRENKAYSYTEQLEEIQLRKELEEKRKQSGKPVQYTPKQKEAIRNQMAKEKAIRDRIRTLHKRVSKTMICYGAAFKGNPELCAERTVGWITNIVNLLRSPLSAPDAVKLYGIMGRYLFDPPHKADLVIQISLRLFEPKCDLDPEWQKCSLLTGIKNTLEYLQAELEKGDFVSGPKFTFTFPMLEKCLVKYPDDTNMMGSILQIMLTIAKEPSTLHGRTRLLLREELFHVLYSIIAFKEGAMQQVAVNAIIQATRLILTGMEKPKEQKERDREVEDHQHIFGSCICEIEAHARALTTSSKVSRSTAMRCLNLWSDVECMHRLKNEKDSQEIFAHIYRSRFDSSSEIATLAQEAWESLKMGSNSNNLFYKHLFLAVLHPCEEIRASGAKALAEYLKTSPTKMNETVTELRDNYEVYNIPIAAEVDNLGRILKPEIDRWRERCGVGLVLKEIAQDLPIDAAVMWVEYIVKHALCDRSLAVRNIMLEAAVQIVQLCGPVDVTRFVEVIDMFLDDIRKTESAQYDSARQACVVLMGRLAKHMNPTDPRVKSIFTRLIVTLSTPSEQVQESVANCLPGLVPAVKGEAEEVLKNLLEKVMVADTYGERRGSAFGIAGLVKGLGILSLKQHDIMNVLATGMQDKKNFKRREGSLMCLELLCEFLGRLFEPYIVHVLPYLLQCLGDSNVYVREATENTAKRVMGRLSAHGVKLVLPSLISALDEDSWRTKCGSVELLGRMAYCAPKQLSSCLPMIVPRLIEVLGDSHVKVQESGAKALGVIGSVIQNPEIQSVVPVLLQALQDPGKRSSSCLQCLLQTEFVHFVDPPSLALIMPVVQRAFQDRSTENRKMACQVIGNMYSLTDYSDLAPYMENVMPGIKASLVDPVPEVRSVAAKALGSMTRGMGDKCYDELLPWLMKTLISDVNSVDRSGAAQGLAEVIGALGVEKLHQFMPEIIKKADCDDLAPHVRDGYMMMFIYMPGVFESEFVPYIGQIINPVLKALADENEFVRETALRAGQRIVTGFAESAITLLLPELEKGIFDDNWRIRFSSIQLLGDLLFKISGVSGKMSTESAGEDDNFGTEQSQYAIINTLGLERRNRVLAGLYMGRSDVALMVRQAALHVWKVVVANTPKTLREILSTLFSLLLGCLASSSHDKRQVAARTLGDLVRKLGEKILPEIIPILERGLDSPRADERQGVCIGLSEIMASTSREMILAFVDNLVPTLRKALCDSMPQVREAAAKTFGSLHSTVGSRALDEVLPFLMKKLSDPEEGEYALDGLGQILVVKSKAVMPYLIPQLTARPINTKALAILASVAGEAMARHLSKVIPALLTVLAETAGTPSEQEEIENCRRIILTIVDDQGVRLLVDDLLEHLRSDKEGFRRSSVTLLSIFCINTKADIEPYMPQLIRGLFLLMTDEDEVILGLLAEGLGAIIKNLDNSEKMSYVGDVRQAVRFVQSDLKPGQLLPGLCTSKGISPVLPVFREALLNGGADVKEQAALGMGELIALTSETALKPSVIHITGPLIRILGDRYGPTVKVAVMDTLTLLLSKVGPHLKAFLPQLQTTFLKAASEPNRSVRLKAAVALAQLIPFHSKPDPMFMDLINNVKQVEDVSIKDTLLYSLRCILLPGASKLTEATRKTISSTLVQVLSSGEDTTSIVAAGAFGVLMANGLPPAELESAIHLILQDENDPAIRQTRSTAIVVALRTNCSCLWNEKYQERITKYILSLYTSDKVPVVSNGLRASCCVFIHCISNQQPTPVALLQPFTKSLNNPNNEVKILLGQSCEVIGRQVDPSAIPKDVFRSIVPTLVMGTKEKNSIVRASCESALVCLLNLRQTDNVLNKCMDALDPGAKETLNDVVAKVLRKLLNTSDGREPDIDDSILS